MSLLRTVNAGEIYLKFYLGDRYVRERQYLLFTYQSPIGLRVLTTTEVAERPCGAPQHAKFVLLAEESEQGPESTLLENVVAAFGAVTGDIAKGPDGLFADIENRRAEQIDELGDGAGLDNSLSDSTSNVCQSPGSFKLATKQGVRRSFDKDKRECEPEAWNFGPA